MALTPAQAVTLKAFVLADPVLSLIPHTLDGAYALADGLNKADAANFIVWRTSTDADTIMDAVTWANLTPTDAPDATATFTNRALACQAKQLNLQILLQGRQTLGTGKVNVRQGLNDALTNVPSGIAGTLADAGWLGAGKVKAAITRPATVVEKLFATGTGTSGSPATLVIESPFPPVDLMPVMGW